MILYISSVIMWIFICMNLFFKAHCGLGFKIFGTLVVLCISLKYEFYQIAGGAFFAPQLPRWVLLICEALYGAFILLFFILLLWDLYLVGNYILSRIGIPVPTRLPTAWLKAGFCLLALGLGCWCTYQATRVPDVRTITLKIPNLPQELTGIKLAQLTDLHIGPILKRDWLKEVVAKVNRLEADLVLLTGDYVDGYVGEIGEELEPLADLKARYGVFAVSGNHEYYWDMPAWKKALTNLKMDFLDNEHRAVHINNKTLIIAGIPDLAGEKFGFAGPDLAKALANAPEGVRILLSHQPKNASGYLHDVDLVLSGHTHGGLMFFLQPLLARFNGGFVNGSYHEKNGNIYVSPGTGLWNGFSCRIGVPPEITLFILARDAQ